LSKAEVYGPTLQFKYSYRLPLPDRKVPREQAQLESVAGAPRSRDAYKQTFVEQICTRSLYNLILGSRKAAVDSHSGCERFNIDPQHCVGVFTTYIFFQHFILAHDTPPPPHTHHTLNTHTCITLPISVLHACRHTLWQASGELLLHTTPLHIDLPGRRVLFHVVLKKIRQLVGVEAGNRTRLPLPRGTGGQLFAGDHLLGGGGQPCQTLPLKWVSEICLNLLMAASKEVRKSGTEDTFQSAVRCHNE